MTNSSIKIKSPSSEAGQFTCDLEYTALTEDELFKLNQVATKDLFYVMKEKVIREIPGLLTYANFFGEAEEHMVSKGIPFNKQIREAYAKAIREELMNNLDKALVLDDEGFISISPYIFSLEFGDFYRPATHFISACIKQWLDEVTESST
jgi:hypothetical protein